jgi:hypothetical protein
MTQTFVLDCALAKFIRRLVQVWFNLSLPTSMHLMLNDWLGGINRKLKCHILAGSIVMCMEIWVSRSDVVFDKSIMLSYL